MACKKYQLTNTGTTYFYFNYKRCSDQMWQYETQLNPSQTKTIWLEDGTYSSPFTNSAGASIVDLGDFPPSGTTTASTSSTNISYKNKSILVLSSLSGSSNWHYSVLNYDKTTILGPIDTGLNKNVYDNYDYTPHTDAGYMMLFHGNSSIISIFLDYQGNTIQTYSATTNYYDTYTTSSFQILIDNQNGVLIYSNGISVNTINFDANSDFSVDTEYDNSIKDAFIVYSGSGFYSSYNLVNIHGIKPLYNWDARLYEVNIPKYEYATFVPILAYSTYDEYTFMNIYSSNGTILQNINLLNLGNSYDNYDLTFYGSNKMNIIFWNGNDIEIPYVIYNYDGDTNTLVMTTHNRGNNYSAWYQWFDYFYGYVYGFPSEDIHILFYDGNYSSSNDLQLVSYCDILSYFNGDTSYREPYVFQDSGVQDKKIVAYQYNGFLGSTFMTLVDTGNNNLSLLAITPSNVNVSIVCSLSSLDDYGFGNWVFGDKFAFTTFSSGGGCGVLYLYNSNGVQVDAKPWMGEYNIYSAYDTLVFEDINNCWYFNLTTTSLTALNDFYWFDTSNSYYSPNNHENSNILMINMSGFMRVLTSNNITQQIKLPETYLTINIGKDLISYLSRNNNGKLVVRVYDLTLKLLTTIITNENDYDNFNLIENRVYLQTYINSDYIYYLIKPFGAKSVTLSDYSNRRVANDYTWWD